MKIKIIILFVEFICLGFNMILAVLSFEERVLIGIAQLCLQGMIAFLFILTGVDIYKERSLNKKRMA